MALNTFAQHIIFYGILGIVLYSAATIESGSVKKLKCVEGQKPLPEQSDSKWLVVRNYSVTHYAWRYGDINTTHCECRKACLELDGCIGYDWYPIGWNNTKCWIGNNCPSTLSFDLNNQRYILRTKMYCYPNIGSIPGFENV